LETKSFATCGEQRTANGLDNAGLNEKEEQRTEQVKNFYLCFSSPINNQRYMAPLGAYLMLSGFILAIVLVFSFVFLPLGSDKVFTL
jgi:hypothetical protein